MEKVIIAIPARLESQRLPNKVLADINNKTMLKRVYDQCSLAKLDCKIYHVSTGKETSMKILLSELSKLFDKEISNIVYKKPRVGDMKKSYSKSNKISKDLKWRHSVTLTKGLKKTLNWYKKI